MYNVILENVTCDLVEKKSKFIANLIYVENKEDADNKLKEIKKKYHDARHNCYAYRVLENNELYEKSSDDGEPSGTAGAPMLNLLQKNNLINCIAIVTRYFGGILLGTGGLVRAYSNVIQEAIENTNKSKIELATEYKIHINYTNFQNFQYYAKKNNIEILKVEYKEEIECNILVSNLSKEKFLKDFSSAINVEICNTKWKKIP